MNSDFYKKWIIQPTVNEKSESIILYYQAGKRDPIEPVWNGNVTELGESKFNGTLSVNVVGNTEVKVNFQNIQESMVLYLMVHFVDYKSTEMHAYYSTIQLVLKGLLNLSKTLGFMFRSGKLNSFVLGISFLVMF